MSDDECPSAVVCATHDGLPTAYIPSPDGASEVVLVDGGGPGLSMQTVLANIDSLGVPDGVGVMVVGERMDTLAPSSACLADEADRLAGISDSPSNSACDLTPYVFDPRRYKQAIDFVVDANSLRLIGAIGISFGANRVLAGTDPDVPLLLVTPAPIAVPLVTVANGRARRTIAAARDACRTSEQCLDHLSRLDARPLADDQVNKAFGLIAAAADRAELRRAVRRLPRSATGDYWTRLSFASTFRFGDGAVLPNLLSFRSGTCSNYAQTSAEPASALAEAYLRVLDCPDGMPFFPTPTTQRRGCVVYFGDDLVAPPDMSSRRLQQIGISVSRRSTTAHGRLTTTTTRAFLESLPGLASC